jgi:lysophospholipase L1-like esterase
MTPRHRQEADNAVFKMKHKGESMKRVFGPNIFRAGGTRRFCLGFLVVILQLLAAGFLTADPALSLPASLKPESQYRNAKFYDWDRRHQAVLKRNSSVKPEVVFIGDSITHFWGGEPSDFPAQGEDSWKAMIGSHVASNLGFGFDYIDNAYYRVQNGELDGITPKVIVILLGTNNVGYRNDTPAACADNMRAFLALVRQKSPKSKIILLGILPRGDVKLNQAIFAAKRLYSEMADGKEIFYADVGKAFLPMDATKVPVDLMPDGVHPNARSYWILEEGVKAQFVKMGF